MPRRYDRRRDMRRHARDMREREIRRGREYDMAMRGRYGDREHTRMHSSADYLQSDYARGRRNTEQRRQPDMHYGYPYTMKVWRGEPSYDYNYDYGYGYDYADGGDYLTEDELDEWAHELLKDVDPKDKQFFTEENIHEKAKIMNIQFDKFTPEELYVTTLMQYTDYKDVIGTSSPEIFVAMAKAWLNDDDSELKQGEKLAVYYDEIICAEE